MYILYTCAKGQVLHFLPPKKKISSPKLLTTHHLLKTNEDIYVSSVLPLPMWLLSVNGDSTSPSLSEFPCFLIVSPFDQESLLVLPHRLTSRRFQSQALV